MKARCSWGAPAAAAVEVQVHMIVVVEPAGRTPCFFVCFVSWLEIMRANRAVKGACGPGFQLSADAACQPVALEELWLQLNKRGVRDADRRI